MIYIPESSKGSEILAPFFYHQKPDLADLKFDTLGANDSNSTCHILGLQRHATAARHNTEETTHRNVFSYPGKMFLGGVTPKPSNLLATEMDVFKYS